MKKTVSLVLAAVFVLTLNTVIFAEETKTKGMETEMQQIENTGTVVSPSESDPAVEAEGEGTPADEATADKATADEATADEATADEATADEVPAEIKPESVK